jgi:hypothetical protein
MKLESAIEREACDLCVVKLGVPSLKLNVRGNTGMPDRLFWTPNKPILIEFKRPGQTPTPKQLFIHKTLRRRGYRVEVHDDAERAFRAVKRWMEKNK